MVVVGLAEQEAAKIVPWLEDKGTTFPVLLNERTRGQWNDPPGGNHALDIIIGRDGVVHTIDNGLATEDVATIVDELLAQ